MPGEKIRVMIVDDVSETRENVRKLLQFESDVEVVGVARTGKEAIQVSQDLQPDVVLMDMDLPLGREQVEGSKLEIVERFDRPTVLPVRSHEPLEVFLATKELGMRRPRLIQCFATQTLCGLVNRCDGLGQRSPAGRADSGILSAQQFLGLG